MWQFELSTNFREVLQCPEKVNKVIPHLGGAGKDNRIGGESVTLIFSFNYVEIKVVVAATYV